MRLFAGIALLLVGALFASNPALAQNYNLEPAYGTVTMGGSDARFSPQPNRVYLRSGGPIDASVLGGGCAGFIANAPDVRLHYTGNRSSLKIAVQSYADTTIVVNAPDGRWYCDDDGGSGLNPELLFEQPQTGRYEIWVGTYGEATYQDATLEISEPLFSREALPNSNATPSGYGEYLAGSDRGPVSFRVMAGGPVDVSPVGFDCVGFVETAPHLSFRYYSNNYPWNGESEVPLTFEIRGGAIESVLIESPGGTRTCYNLSYYFYSDRVITLERPYLGYYNLWFAADQPDYPFSVEVIADEIEPAPSVNEAPSDGAEEPETPQPPTEPAVSTEEQQYRQ